MKPYPGLFKWLNISSVFIALLFAGCNSNTENLQAQIDSLNQRSAQAYKPGLGEFMSAIQVHHAKLWFAGKNQNWKLADFEMGEIQESVNDIKKYCTDRPEVRSLPMLYPALDSLNNAIKLKSLERFKSAFTGLTNTCNSCHQTTHHEFNVIKIPDTPPFTNQDFKAQ
jgi:hypothetical protein